MIFLYYVKVFLIILRKILIYSIHGKKDQKGGKKVCYHRYVSY